MDDDGSVHSSLFGDLSTEEVTSKIILTAIIVLFMAVLCILILHLYAKLYWWRLDQLQQQQQQEVEEPPLATRRQRRRFIFVPGQVEEEEEDAKSNTGLTPFELTSLPILRQDGLECAICLSELVHGDKARLLPKCSHSFHVECIDMWFVSHSTCPICRTTVLGPDQSRLDNGGDATPTTTNNNNNNINHHHDALSQVSSMEFPTNVLVWGRQDRVSTGHTNVASQEDGVGGNVAASQSQETVVLDIDDPTTIRTPSVPSSSSLRFIAQEEESKSPMTTRLRSLRRFLSRDKRVACSNTSSSSSSTSSNAASGSVDP